MSFCTPQATSSTQIWDPAGIIYDPNSGLPTTGRWRSLTTNDINGSGSYSSFFAIVTGGLVYIPAGAKSWSVGVVSGDLYINNAGPIQGQVGINGGGYNGHSVLGSPIPVSGTVGSHALLLWET